MPGSCLLAVSLNTLIYANLFSKFQHKTDSSLKAFCCPELEIIPLLHLQKHIFWFEWHLACYITYSDYICAFVIFLINLWTHGNLGICICHRDCHGPYTSFVKKKIQYQIKYYLGTPRWQIFPNSFEIKLSYALCLISMLWLSQNSKFTLSYTCYKYILLFSLI